MTRKQTHEYDGRCAIPPHPELQARLAAEALRVQSNLNTVPDPSLSLLHGNLPTGKVPGLNDGTIFPESHFEKAPSPSELSRAALERVPLSGTIR
jgi:immune inhibitor A